MKGVFSALFWGVYLLKMLALVVVSGWAFARSRWIRPRTAGELSPGPVLHLVPEDIGHDRLWFHGATKDIRGRSEFFRARGIAVEELAVLRDDREIMTRLKTRRWDGYRSFFLDVPSCYPRTIRWIKKTYPGARVFYRAFNAEFPHRWDHFRAEKGPLREKLRMFLRAYRLFFMDIWAVSEADAVLTITDAEQKYYARIGGKDKVYCVPYFLPAIYQAAPAKESAKGTVCVSIGSAASPGGVTQDAFLNFCRLVQGLEGRLQGWSFLSTGDWNGVAVPSRVHKLGRLDSPFEALAEAKAVAVLSDLGRGFKTKILDGIVAKAFVLVSPRMYKRLPAEVRPLCKSVVLDSPRAFEAALIECEAPFPAVDANELLRDRAFKALDRILCVVDEKSAPRNPAAETPLKFLTSERRVL